MQIWMSLIIIIMMTLISKTLRGLAFGRSDSIALEVAICSFLYNLMYAIAISSSVDGFIHNELMRCVVLLLFAFVIAATHKHYKELSMAMVDKQVERLKAIRSHTTRHLLDDDGQAEVEDVVLEHTPLIARASIDVWYSQFADKMFYRILRKADKGDVKSFRKKKSLVRWAFADILNSLNIADEDERKLDDKDFNIDNKNQITGMIIFDLMEFLSLIVAIRLI